MVNRHIDGINTSTRPAVRRHRINILLRQASDDLPIFKWKPASAPGGLSSRLTKQNFQFGLPGRMPKQRLGPSQVSPMSLGLSWRLPAQFC